MVDRRTVILAALGGLGATALGGCRTPSSDTDGGSVTPVASGTSRTPTRTPDPTTTPPLAVRRPRPPGPLVGVGAWKTDDTAGELADCAARWYYTWSPDHAGISTPDGTEFVPMIEDRTALTTSALATAKANGNTLLGFNEPELKTHANMTVHEVLDAWPLLERTGMRLGGPAVAGDADVVDSYFYTFMAGARARGYRVDFTPVHWYLSPALRENFSIRAAVQDLSRYLQAVHAQYKLPVWLTEFSLITWYQTSQHVQDPQVQAEFLHEAAAMMRPLTFLERWAWFSLNPVHYATGVALYDAHGGATPVAKAFRTVS